MFVSGMPWTDLCLYTNEYYYVPWYEAREIVSQRLENDPKIMQVIERS